MEVKYDGKYPNLCSGRLIVRIDKIVYDFHQFCLESCGSCYIDNNSDECVEQGEWRIVEYPANFPEKYKKELIEKINDEIPQGCCGGCI